MSKNLQQLIKGREEEILNKLAELGYVDAHSLRDFRIIKRYKFLRSRGTSGKAARKKISAEMNVGDETVQYVLYKKKR